MILEEVQIYQKFRWLLVQEIREFKSAFCPVIYDRFYNAAGGYAFFLIIYSWVRQNRIGFLDSG